MQQACGNRRRVHLHFRQNFGNLKRMNDIRLSGGAHLSFMMLYAELPRFADQRDILIGAVGLDSTKQSLETFGNGVRIVWGCAGGLASIGYTH